MWNSNFIIFITSSSSALQPMSFIKFTKIKSCNNNNFDEEYVELVTPQTCDETKDKSCMP